VPLSASQCLSVSLRMSDDHAFAMIVIDDS
jgi:hypothetical protein